MKVKIEFELEVIAKNEETKNGLLSSIDNFKAEVEATLVDTFHYSDDFLESLVTNLEIDLEGEENEEAIPNGEVTGETNEEDITEEADAEEASQEGMLEEGMNESGLNSV